MAPVEAGFGFGSNVGDGVANVRRAAALLGEGGVRIIALSSLYRTAPWGDPDQAPFINACAAGETRLAPHDLLALCKDVEARMGRMPTRRWGPRLIDVDILYMDGVALAEANLTLPHPEIARRAFVLAPLAEIRPDLVVDGTSARDALACIGDEGIERIAGFA